VANICDIAVAPLDKQASRMSVERSPLARENKMLVSNRRGFVKRAGAVTTALWGSLTELRARAMGGGLGSEATAAPDSGEFLGEAMPLETALDNQEIYRLLGFATMSGEDPLKLWQRLKNTQQWRVGPLSPDSWSGSVFVADDADIFAFRTLSLPDAWVKDAPPAKHAEYCAQHFDGWWSGWAGKEQPGTHGIPGWWKFVGPKAWDNSYARLVWQMPEEGPEVTYEWAQTGKNEVVGRLTHSQAAPMVLQGYIPWDSAPPQFSGSTRKVRSGASCADGRGFPVPATACAGYWL
jgi:hypothetical protein